jgi:hypothetical protein
MVALGAIALYSGARLPRKWALTIPLVIVAFSDFAIDFSSGYSFDPASRLTTYIVFTALALAGSYAPKNASPITRVGMSLFASTAFFSASNFAVWFEGSGLSFPRTLAGLMSTYAVALPFYANTLVADLIGTGILFGLDAILSRREEIARQPVA